MIPANQSRDAIDKGRVEACLDQFGPPPAPIDQKHHEPVYVGITEAEFALVSLAHPKIARRRFFRIDSGTPRYAASG